MKRARVTTRSEAARARARPCPVSPDTLLALLDDVDGTVGQLCISTSALASLSSDLVARNNEATTQASVQVNSTRLAILARKTQVLGLVKRLFRKQRKGIVADFEAVDVSTEQLPVLAAVAFARAGLVCPDFDCALASLPLLASPRSAHAPATGVDSDIKLAFGGELACVATGDGLRVVSAAGPGLKWFEPHSRNEFSVVLAQADGRVPVWLTSGDVAVDSFPAGVISTGSVTVGTMSCTAGSIVVAARSESMGPPVGTVSAVYEGLSEDALEVMLQLTVCGVAVGGVAGERKWGLRVCRRLQAGHSCAAVGTHVASLTVAKGFNYGMAVSADEKWLVVGLVDWGTLSVYSLPGGELVRTFGGRGDGPLQFKGHSRLCFAPNGNLIVVDRDNSRLQEGTLEGVFVRFIGVGQLGDGSPFSVAVLDDIIAVGCIEGTGPRVVLFDFGTGAVMSRFGEVGTAPGQLCRWCSGIRLTTDGSHVIVAEIEAKRLSLFTTAGVFVRCVGVGLFGGGCEDVLLSVSGEFVVADYDNHRVCVFSPDGSELVRSWGVEGTGDGQFLHPTALAAAGRHLYVMDFGGGRVQVFE